MNAINAQTIINEVMAAHAVAPDEATSFISFRTSAKGLHRIRDCKENLQRFADMVRKNAAAFGGGIVREVKAKPAISWPANLISLFKQSIEGHDYQAALDIGDKLGALFFVDNKGAAQMQVAPVPCDFESRLSSVCNENGTYAVIFPQNMTSLSGASVKAKRSRQSQIDNVQTALNARTNFNLSEALDKQSFAPVDQVSARAQWIMEHGLSAETIEARIVAHETESIEAMAAQDVAHVIADAVAAVAISEAMQPSETAESRELVTCEAGESEAHAVTVGSVSGATWAPVPQYVPCPPDKTGLGDGPAPAFRGDDGDTPTPPPAEFLGDATPPVTISTDYAGDIPLSLAVSAYSGTSFSPDRRGQSAKSEYGQSMAADYETLHAQAVKGGTLDLLPEVFARYRARQSSAYKAYLSSSSRCVSSFIAGPSNFPAARMNKRSDIAHKRLGEYLNGGEMALQAACRTLRPDLRAIMAGDADAIDRLTVELNSAERLQNQMKACNKAIRANAKAGEAHQVAALMELGHSEAHALELLHPRFSRGQGFPSFSLTNNQANIRRMRARLEQITAAKARTVETVECANGVTLEDDAPANRVRLYFPGKPSEAIRDELKSSGFRWAPSVGAWQAYRNNGTLATAKRMAGEPIEAPPAPVAAVEIEAMAPAVESTETPAPTVTEFLPTSPVYQLPEKQDDWNGAKYSADFVPNARQQIVIDAVQTALNEGKYYTSDVLARCIELLNIDAHTASMNFGMRVEGGIVGMDCYYARGYIDAKKAREASLKTFNEMALREGDELGILVFSDYKRTTGVKITGISEGGSTFTFTGKRGAYTVSGTGSADQLKCAIDRAFTTGKRKTDYAAFLATQAKRPAPTPPAVESQPTPPVVETPDTLESFDDTGDGVSDALYEAVQSATIAHVQALTDAQFSKLYDHLENWNFHAENILLQALRTGVQSLIDEITEVIRLKDATGCGLSGPLYDRYMAACQAVWDYKPTDPEATQAQDVPQTTHASDSHGWEPAIGERYIGAVEYAVQEANKRGDGFEYRTGEEALMERRKKNTVPTLRGEWLAATQGNRIESKSGKWTAWTFKTAMGAFGLGFMQWDNFVDLSDYMTAKDRMKALQGMARAVDDFTPPGGGLPCPEPVAVVEPVASVAPTPPPAVSSASPTPRVAARRNFIPDNGLHVVEDAFEAWTFTSGARFAFVMYLGKSAKPWKYYGYSTKAKRDDGFNRHAQEARSIALSKANRKAESKAQSEKPHGLQVGDVVRSSWGYDQTNVDHYQIVKVIGKRTVEVRKLVEHKESTGDMTGRLAPVYGEFVGEVMRRQVDSLGKVNILQASYGRASKIEPLAIVHGVRCYAASSYSSYA